MCACLLSHFSCVQLFVILWTAACQAHLFMRFSRQKYWSGLPSPSPGGLPNTGIKLVSLASLRWQAVSLPVFFLLCHPPHPTLLEVITVDSLRRIFLYISVSSYRDMPQFILMMGIQIVFKFGDHG